MEFTINKRVEHDTLGKGVVTNVYSYRGRTYYDIHFDSDYCANETHTFREDTVQGHFKEA